MRIIFIFLLFIILCEVQSKKVVKIAHRMNTSVQSKNLLKKSKSLKNNSLGNNTMRFSEKVQVSEKVEDKSNMPPQQWVEMQEAWASSVYTYRSWWWTFAYHASNPLTWGLWLSKFQGWDSKQVVTWEAFLKQYQLLEAISIFWRFAPGECEIQTSPDGGTTWQIQLPMGNCKWDPIKDLGLARWQMWHYYSFQKRYLFEVPAFTKKVRILMKDAIFGYYGMQRVAPLVRGWGYAYMFRNADQSTANTCLSVLNGDYQRGVSLVVQDCADAIINADGRELQILYSQDQRIWSLVSGLCWRVDDSFTIPEIVVDNCRHDARDKWIMSATGKIMSKHMDNKCIGRSQEKIQLTDLEFKAEATSEIWGGINQPSQAITGTSENHSWKSRPGIKTNVFEVNFEPISLNAFSIKWLPKLFPSDYRVYVKAGRFWKMVYTTQGSVNEINETNNINMNTFTYTGIKIEMFDGQGLEKDGDAEKIAYGIQKITIDTNVYKADLVDCDDESLLNQWELHDITWFDTMTKKVIVRERKYVDQDFGILMNLILKLEENHKIIIPNMVITGHEINRLIEEIIHDISDYTIKIHDYKELFKVEIYGEMPDVKPDPLKIDGVIGSQVTSSAKSCHEIKKKFAYKRSGWYWIRSPCMPVARRMFCDMITLKDFLYVGETNKNLNKFEKDSNLHKIRDECHAMGLHPIELNTFEDVKMLQSVLPEYSIQQGSNEYIPIAFDYDCEKGLCKAQFKSFNSADSPNLGPVFNNMLPKYWLVLYMMDSSNCIALDQNMKPKIVKLAAGLKMKGLVCSTNYNHEFESSLLIDIDCDTVPYSNLDFVGGLYTQFSVNCPPGCAKNPTKVVGSQMYTDDSSICKAAIHNGIIKDLIGGTLTIAFDKGSPSYESKWLNEIKSQSFYNANMPWQRSFVTNKFRRLCPQGVIEDGNFDDNQELQFLQTKAVVTKKQKNSFLQVKDDDDNQEKKDQKNKSNQNNDNNNNQQDENKEQEQGGNDPSKSAQSDANEEEGEEEEKPLTTATAIEVVQSNLKSIEVELDSMKVITLENVAVREKTDQDYGPLINSDIAPSSQERDILNVENDIQDIENKITYWTAASKRRHEKFARRKRQLKLMILKLMEYEKFQEHYLPDKVEDLWEIVSNKKAGKTIPKWRYTEQMWGEPDLIVQDSPIKVPGNGCLDSMASHMYLPNRIYYDAVFRASIVLAHEGSWSMMFRYIDEFNYYAFQVVTEKTVKEIRQINEYNYISTSVNTYQSRIVNYY